MAILRSEIAIKLCYPSSQNFTWEYINMFSLCMPKIKTLHWHLNITTEVHEDSQFFTFLVHFQFFTSVQQNHFTVIMENTGDNVQVKTHQQSHKGGKTTSYGKKRIPDFYYVLWYSIPRLRLKKTRFYWEYPINW